MEKFSKERSDELYDRYSSEPEENYQYLRKGKQGMGDENEVDFLKRHDTIEILEKYVNSTDEIIGVIDGSITERDIIDPSNPERAKELADTVIFLDKSARPVSYLVDAFWEQFAKDDVKKPDYDFLNIDRVNWFMSQGHSREISERYLGPSDFDIDKVPPEKIAGIRALFVEGDLTEKNWENEVWDLPTRLDGKNILIVDEVKNKGGTLSIATQLVRAAIPESTVSGHYFWRRPGTIPTADNSTRLKSVPVWYSSENPFGRGVGDVSIAYQEHAYEQNPTQENLKRMLGSFAISAPHHNANFEIIEDTMAKSIEQDIAYLSYAVGDKRIFRRPSGKRGLEEFTRIIEEQGLTMDDVNGWINPKTRKKIDHKKPRYDK